MLEMVGASPGQVRGKLAGFFFHPAGVFFFCTSRFLVVDFFGFYQKKTKKIIGSFFFFPDMICFFFQPA